MAPTVTVTQTGFHGAYAGSAGHDTLVGNATNTALVIDPSINNNTSTYGEGKASGVSDLILQSPDDTTWAPATPVPGATGTTPTGSLNLKTLGDPTNVWIGGDGSRSDASFNDAGLSIESATFTGAASSETFYVDTYSTGALTGQIFDFDFGNAKSQTLNLVVENHTGDQKLTLRNFTTTSGPSANPNPIGTLNFTAATFSVYPGPTATTTLTIDGLNALATLNLLGDQGGAATTTWSWRTPLPRKPRSRESTATPTTPISTCVG